jgi:hypothetical protein
MTTIAPAEAADATGQAAELLEQVQKTFGLIPNMTKVMANSPALLEGYLALSDAIACGRGQVSGGTIAATRQAGVTNDWPAVNPAQAVA